MKFGVVGHVEWVEFARVERVPRAGEVVHAQAAFAEPAGGGAVAAVELARLSGAATLFTALGDDEIARLAIARLNELGVDVHAVERAAPTRRAITFLDERGERTITTLGDRLDPRGGDPLPWTELAGCDGVYFTAGDAAALRAARAARVLVASPRARAALTAGVELDALVYSARDPLEVAAAGEVDPPPRLHVQTRGADGGSYDGTSQGSWSATQPPGPPRDTYGCGDSFAAALTHALADERPLAAAFEHAASSGAACLTRDGPYGR